MLFTIISVRRKMRTGPVNVKKENKSKEPSTVGHVISQNDAGKGNSDFNKTVSTKGRSENSVSINQTYSHPI